MASPMTATTWPATSYDRLKVANMEQIFQSGLHEFLQEFILGNTRLSQSIAKNYNFP